ncbi:MAG: carbon-nitrogen hydrolase family protein [Alphaproteobacteria bacterium]
MTSRFKAACIQLNSGADVDANMTAAADLVRRARDDGADLIALPENTPLMVSDTDAVRVEDGNPELQRFKELARDTGAWILVGSMKVALSGDEKRDEAKMANRSFLISSDGEVEARYDKIHMFDVDLGGAENHRESDHYKAGDKAVLAEMPWGQLGLSICYDLRFAYLYRQLAHAGAEVLAVPAAFTRISGEAHWHVLQRARAIETGCFVIAPAQCGDHPGGRQTFGHSLIVDPWGRVLADGGEQPGFITADIDLGEVVEARRKIPALSHDRDIKL